MSEKNTSDRIGMPEPYVRYIQGELAHDEEISLIDLWKVLVKRKWLLFGIILTIIFVVGIWIFISKPVYESRSVLLVGKVDPAGQLEPPQTLIQRLKEEYRVDDTTEGKRELPLVEGVRLVDKAVPDAIVITARGYSAPQAQSFLKKIVEKILREHKDLYEIGLTQQEKLLDLLQANRKQIQNALLETQKHISSAHVDPSVSGLLSLEMDRLSSELLDIDQRESQLRLSMSELKSKDTELIRRPTLPVHPVKPKPVLYMLIATMAGLFLGIVMVFVAEFLAKVRSESSKESADVGL